MINRRQALSLAASTALPLHAFAQNAWPTQPIRFIQPSAVGGASDAMCRAVAEPLSKMLGQPVIVEAKPGAGGVVAARYVANQPADGYTILSHHSGFVTAPLLSATAGYDPLKDFEPVSLKGGAPVVLLAHPSMPETLSGFVAYARANPGKLEWGTAALGGIGHLASEVFQDMAGIKDMVRVAYNGSAPATQAVVGGQIKYLFSAMTPATAGLVKEGRLRLYGHSSAQRSALFPDLPSIAEVVPGFDVQVWYGFSAPKGTPADVLQKLGDAITRVVAQPEVTEKFRAIGVLTKGGRSELGEVIKREQAMWGKVIREKGIKLDT